MEVVGVSAVPPLLEHARGGPQPAPRHETSMSYCGRRSRPPYRRSAKTSPLSWSAGMPCCDRLLASSSNASSSTVGGTGGGGGCASIVSTRSLGSVARLSASAIARSDEADEMMPAERLDGLARRLADRRELRRRHPSASLLPIRSVSSARWVPRLTRRAGPSRRRPSRRSRARRGRGRARLPRSGPAPAAPCRADRSRSTSGNEPSARIRAAAASGRGASRRGRARLAASPRGKTIRASVPDAAAGRPTMCTAVPG